MPPGAVVPKKRRGCFATGCLASLAVLLVVVVVAAGLWFRLPQKLGLWPTGESMWSGEPDRTAAAAILAELKTGGVDTTGMTLYVMPVANSQDVVAYAVLDLSRGFRFPTGGDRPGILDLLVKVASTGASTAAGVDHIGLEYRDRSGSTVGVLTATPDQIASYARGDLTDEQFRGVVGGWIDPAFLVKGVSE